ncbi:MAG: adenylate/guanylate cyclase domain-containing protein [Chloroflexota bacterium]
MGKLQKRNLGAPDELRSVGRGQLAIVEVGDAVVGQITFEPGWRWSVDVRPIVGTGLCEVHHVGYIISGSLHTEMRDGSMLDVEAGDVYELPPGHDSWVVGDEPCVSLDWTGNRFYGESPNGTGERVLATILFTDIVGSTQLVAQLGDHAWRDRLSEYHALVRRVIERHRGLEIQTTGDGMLARFDSPARAVACAVDLARATPDLGFEQRAGLHTGEVEFAGDDVRGIAVHLAARVAAAANAGEVLVSAVTNGLLFGSGLTTVSRGNHSLKGMERAVELFVVEV